jgi:hypothetical protein
MGLAVGSRTTVARRPARLAISTTNLGQLALIICRLLLSESRYVKQLV